MEVVLGLITTVAVMVGLPLTIYAVIVGGKKIGTGSGKFSLAVAGIATVGVVWWYFDTALILTNILLIAVGVGLLSWSKTPDFLKSIGRFMAGSGALMVFLLLLVGPNAVQYRKDQLTAVIGGQEAPPSPPLSPAEQAQRLEQERQDAEVARLRTTSEAAAQVQAEEAARLTRLVSAQLPDSVQVVHCDRGWSEEILIPAGWYMKYSWSGRTTGIQYLQDGTWNDAITAHISGDVEAFRFCTTSLANLNLNNGNMPLAWSPN